MEEGIVEKNLALSSQHQGIVHHDVKRRALQTGTPNVSKSHVVDQSKA
jgi:hypothetical protein